MTCRRLLILWHSRTGAARQLADAAAHGARQVAHDLADSRLRVQCCNATAVTLDDWLRADGYLFCAPENLGSLSGAMKECFDQAYYALEGRIEGRPYALAIAAGTDGEGARRQVERIVTGWRLQAIAPALIARNGAQQRDQILAPKRLSAEHADAAAELGGTLAGWLLLG